MFVYRLRSRAPGSAKSLPAPRLIVHLDDGMKAAPVPVQLSWTTQDNTHSVVGFSPDMESLYGHRRAPGGDLLEIRGELDERREYSLWAGGTRGYEFRTEVEDAGRWSGAGRLRVLVDEDGGAPLRSASWCDRSGNTWSVALHAVSPSGNEDVTGLVSDVRASAEHPRAGEVAANLVDTTARKWFAPYPTAVLEFRLAQPVEVDRYLLTSANDAPDRDPAVWTLSGSTDGKVWRAIDLRSGESFTARHQPRAYRIAEPDVYDRYRLEITGNNGSPHLQLETVRFLVDGGGGFAGYRQRAGHTLYPYRGTRMSRPRVLLPQPVPERTAEWEGWQPGGSWLPLGGSLSYESLTSPSGRFTALYSGYGPAFSVRDNATHEQVWVSDAPAGALLCLGPDGDLAVWNHRGERCWSAGTGGRGARRLEMRDTGELALTDAGGAVLWSSGIPRVTAAAWDGRPAVARGSTMRRGQSLYGQSLTSADGSTVLLHDGRGNGLGAQALPPGFSQWSRLDHQRPNVLSLDEDGSLCVRTPEGAELEQIAGRGAELAVVRDAVVLRDDAGVVVWSSTAGPRPAPVREPALPRDDDLVAWFGGLVGPGRGYCLAVIKASTPHEVLERAGLGRESVVTATWHELGRRRDRARGQDGRVVAALAVGPDVLLLSDDPGLPVAELAPGSSVTALHLPRGGSGYGTTFSFHRDGGLLSEIRDEPRRRKGARVPEVAVALGEIRHHLDRHELLFRTSGVVPGAAALGGELLGGVLAPHPAPEADPDGLPPLVTGERDEMSPLVIRTDFTDENAWNRIVEGLREPWMENESHPYLVSDTAYEGLPAERIVKAALRMPELERPGAVFIADARAMRDEDHPLLAVSTEWDGEPFAEDEEPFETRFRIRPDAAIVVSINLGIANMDFEDFAGDGVGERMVD
ncbi:DUF6924 domain-containing protein [Streptomyces sp. DW26H14]|uniref:DUF6924 domain-containing protein n=1 Tax=Streptomyces sp. DW26H14 TaxID=3435395 RepID=UPI00403DC7FD